VVEVGGDLTFLGFLKSISKKLNFLKKIDQFYYFLNI
jgi:hypothetical protein